MKRKTTAATEKYITRLPEERQAPVRELVSVLRKNLPEGYEESTASMIGFHVPFSIYPKGYHCPPKQPLPFISIASQKNFIALYHMGIYADPDLLNWFQTEYPKHVNYKLDMGKSCIRFKRTDDIPYDLIAELAGKITVAEWVERYESALKR